MMLAIPAIDIRGGRVVRLLQGRFSHETAYSDSPVDVARQWQECGAEMIHVVDLDGAAAGAPKNIDLVRKIASSVGARLQLGGGIRDVDSINRAIDAGASRVVIGTKALDEKFLESVVNKFGDHIVVGVDASEGLIVVKGWVFKTVTSAIELARKAESIGVRTINYTDINKDGMLTGPNIDSLRELLSVTNMDVVLSGGISSIDDIKKLKPLEKEGLKGIIIGRALYEGKVDLAEAIRVCRRV